MTPEVKSHGEEGEGSRVRSLLCLQLGTVPIPHNYFIEGTKIKELERLSSARKKAQRTHPKTDCQAGNLATGLPQSKPFLLPFLTRS